ncbi:MAG: hypothetical protein AB8B88_06420 [Devosiaceae bacterium]
MDASGAPFFALSIVSAIIGLVGSLLLTLTLSALGMLPSVPIEPQIIDDVAGLFHLAALGAPLSPTPAQYVTTNSINAPWWLAALVFHGCFANISMKRLRDMGLPGGWSYIGVHAVIAPVHFLFDAAGFAALLLFMFSAVLLFVPSNGFK